MTARLSPGHLDAPRRERAALGKAAREHVPRSRHGRWEPAADRADPVALLEEQAASRVPELVPIRYGRMLVSPFTFFRGAALPDGRRSAGAPRTGLDVQLCGDAHLSNFGASPRPTGGWCSASTTSTRRCRARSSGTSSGWSPASRSPGATAASTPSERRAINLDGGARLPRGDARVRRDAQPRPLVRPHRRRRHRRALRPTARARKQRKRFERNVAKARRRTACKAFAKLTRDRRRRAADRRRPAADRADRGSASGAAPRRDRGLRARGDPLLPAHAAGDRRRLLERFRYVHAARKVVGVGSVGTRAWIVLMLGRDDERSAVPAGQGGAGLGARAVPRQERASPTTASASSRASG